MSTWSGSRSGYRHERRLTSWTVCLWSRCLEFENADLGQITVWAVGDSDSDDFDRPVPAHGLATGLDDLDGLPLDRVWNLRIRTRKSGVYDVFERRFRRFGVVLTATELDSDVVFDDFRTLTTFRRRFSVIFSVVFG